MSKTIKVDYMARVEGEAALEVEVDGKEIKKLVVDVFEPPRFFQGFLIGRKFDEVPDLVSRICGICPVSHQITSIQAIENAMGITPSQQVKELRKLFAISQFIQSHSLHIYMLALPDFLGYESILAMADDYKHVVERALRLKRLGNDLTVLLGGREVHPVTAVINGFTTVPSKNKLREIYDRLKLAKVDAIETVKLAAELKLPEFWNECEHAAIYDDSQYAVNEGRLVSNMGLNIKPEDYRKYIKEEHVPPSNALHSHVEGRGSFMVGPLPRLNIKFEKMFPDAKAIAKEVGFKVPNYNPFSSITARAIELVHSIDESIAIIERNDFCEEDRSFLVKAGEGCSITEAPRGILYHKYAVNSQGIIEEADIVTPTAHNVANMERDLYKFIPSILELPDDEITLKCETAIRNYDPCFSCSAHFLKVNIKNCR